MQTKITEALVRKLIAEPPTKDTTVFDTELKRFALRVKPARVGADGKPGKPAAWFFVRYTSPTTGVETRMAVAKADTSVVNARKAAKATLALVDQGHDPAAERAARREVPTIRELATLYMDGREFKAKTPTVQANDRARLEKHIIHHLGARKADSIAAPEARRMVGAITRDARTNTRGRQLGGAGAARKAARLLASMLAWAKADGLIGVVPFTLKELKLEGDGQRDAAITSAEEYAGLFATLDNLVDAGELRPVARAFFALIASTGLRRGEAQGLRWGQVDLARRQLRLDGSKGARLARKAGRTSGAEMLGVPPIAAEALARIRPAGASDDDLVFAPSRGEALSVNRDWLTVRARAGLPENLTIHGLRHSVGTVAALGGMSMPEIQALLRHRQPGTTARYIHFAQVSGGLADKAMGGVLPAPAAASAEVVLLRGTKA